jgi:creatinine amidohydrolase
MLFRATLLLCVFPSCLDSFAQKERAVRLSDIPWTVAETVLDSNTVVVIPMGAGSKEHGPHMRLGCDLMQATWATDRIARTEDVVIAPEVNYGYYPAFVNFPGSTTVRFTAQRDMIVDICRRLSAFGPRRFYMIHIGVSTMYPLRSAAEQLAREGILLHYTFMEHEPGEVALEKEICTQKEGTHADEVETSVMLHMYPDHVDMSKAVAEYGTRNGPGVIVRHAGEPGILAPSGIYGAADLATPEKGKVLSEHLLATVKHEIDSLRHSKPPAPVKVMGLEEYAGTYMTSDSAKFTVQVEGNGLALIHPKGLRSLLVSEERDHFPGSNSDVRFVRNDAGHIRALEAILNDGRYVMAVRQ